MNIFKKWRAYITDNPHGYWFKRKPFGWGWTPVRWQGVVVTVVYLTLVILAALTVDEYSSVREVMFTFILPVVLLTVAFFRIARKRGESPKWMWGFPKGNNSFDKKEEE